jgi:hypothetical protein
MIGIIAAVSVIAAATRIVEAMVAPAVTIAPAGPGTYTKKDPVVKESRPIKAHRRAGIGWSFIVAVGADRRLADFDRDMRSADFDCDLCFDGRRQSQAREQCCCTEKCFESTHM